jgi:hypothetical protein
MVCARTWIVTVGLLLEGVGAAYLCLIGYLMGVWMVGDSVAFRMTSSDWYLEGVKRFAEVCVLAAVSALVVHLFNRWALCSRMPAARLVSVLVFSAICVSGLVGAVEFAVKKPYM